jgi:hypothetical protein
LKQTQSVKVGLTYGFNTAENKKKARQRGGLKKSKQLLARSAVGP